MYSENKVFFTKRFIQSNNLIKCAGSHLFSIGLSLFPFGSKTRKFYYNPILISVIILLSIFKIIFTLFMNEENERIFLLLGDHYYYIKVRYHLSIGTILFGFLAFMVRVPRNGVVFHIKIHFNFTEKVQMIINLYNCHLFR